jgi:hypothetical protein
LKALLVLFVRQSVQVGIIIRNWRLFHHLKIRFLVNKIDGYGNDRQQNLLSVWLGFVDLHNKIVSEYTGLILPIIEVKMFTSLRLRFISRCNYA